MKLRPHHLLDIVTEYGAAHAFEPHPYGHAVHLCAEIVLNDLDTPVEFVAAADFICAPCIHLHEGRCDDVLEQLDPAPSKQDYNDALDRRLFAHLRLSEGDVLTVRDFLQIVCRRYDGLPEICTHPGSLMGERDLHLRAGLRRLGFTI